MREQNYCNETFHWGQKNFCMNDTCGVTLIECCGDTGCERGLHVGCAVPLGGRVMELGVFHTRIWLTSSPEPPGDVSRPQGDVAQESEAFFTLSPSHPVGDKEQHSLEHTEFVQSCGWPGCHVPGRTGICCSPRAISCP